MTKDLQFKSPLAALKEAIYLATVTPEEIEENFTGNPECFQIYRDAQISRIRRHHTGFFPSCVEQKDGQLIIHGIASQPDEIRRACYELTDIGLHVASISGGTLYFRAK